MFEIDAISYYHILCKHTKAYRHFTMKWWMDVMSATIAKKHIQACTYCIWYFGIFWLLIEYKWYTVSCFNVHVQPTRFRSYYYHYYQYYYVKPIANQKLFCYRIESVIKSVIWKPFGRCSLNISSSEKLPNNWFCVCVCRVLVKMRKSTPPKYRNWFTTYEKF